VTAIPSGSRLIEQLGGEDVAALDRDHRGDRERETGPHPGAGGTARPRCVDHAVTS
jgi:hypothetical protein